MRSSNMCATASERRAAVRLALGALTAAALVGCGGGADGASDGRPVAPAAAEERLPPVEELLYGSDGRLLPSGRKVVGLTLPRGLETLREDDGEYSYTTDVPITKVLEYFGPRLFTAQVDRVGTGAVYRAARPLEARGGVVLMDVSILAGSSGTRVTLKEIRSASTLRDPAAAAEARQRMFDAIE